MTAQKGRDIGVLLNTSGAIYTVIAGSREKTLTINNEPVDISNSDDSGIRKLLENAGLNSISIKLSGVYMDDAAYGQLRTLAMANTHANFKVVIPGATVDGYYQGSFMVATVEETGSFKDAVMYSLTLESAGQIAFTAT